MKHIITLISCLIFSCFFSNIYSQHSLEGRIIDKTSGNGLEIVTIRLLSESDSTLIQGTQSNEEGNFILTNIQKGNYILLISCIGYKNHFQNISFKEKEKLHLSDIKLEEDSQQLTEFEVKGKALQMTVKGDTIEYNTQAFKSQENAIVEDLIRRLPGAAINSAGKITIHGEEITKIRLDGKKFFDGDIEMASKNLPADMIEKIQVLDLSSEIAELTGFEDNDTERIINLTTKSNKRNGTFGKINTEAGYDTENNFRYNVNAITNFFNPKSETSIIVGRNNINESYSSFSQNKSSKINNGISTIQQIGINNNSLINDQLKFGLNASFGQYFNDTNAEKEKQTYLKDLNYYNSARKLTHEDQLSASVNFEIEWTPSPLNKFIFQPSLHYNESKKDEEENFLYHIADKTVNFGKNIKYGNTNSNSQEIKIIYNRRFARKGRSLTVDARIRNSSNKANNFNYLFQNSTDSEKELSDQETLSETQEINFRSKISYVESLWNPKNRLQLSFTLHSLHSSANKTLFDNTDLKYFYQLENYKNNKDRIYNIYNFDYSNQFESVFYREVAEANYQYIAEKYSLTLGVRAEPSQLYGYNLSNNDIDTKNSSLYFSPICRFKYKFGKRESLSFRYRGRTKNPSLNQLQPTKNNSDAMHEKLGNPELKPSFSQELRFSYNRFFSNHLSSININLFLVTNKDAMVNNSIYDNTGKQYSQTINSNYTPYFFRTILMYNTPILKNTFQFNTFTSFRFDQFYTYSNRNVDLKNNTREQLPLGNLSSTMASIFNENLSLIYSNKNLEIAIKATLNYRGTSNNLRNSKNEIWEWGKSAYIILHLPKGFNINSNIDHISRQGYEKFDSNELIFNAGIEKKIFKNKGIVSFKCNDILRQKLNIFQTVDDNYIEYNKTNTLTSYFLLSFSYKINQFNENKVDASGTLLKKKK